MFEETTYMIPNWDTNPELEEEIFTQTTSFDALNRPIVETVGRLKKANSTVEYSYNEAGLLESVKANAAEKGEKDYVENIEYNEKGQRTSINYGNNTKTVYEYEIDTFRLTRIVTTSPDGKVQDLNYTYDPIGNITSIINEAEDTIFFNNQRVEPSNEFEYDALSRLIFATGREHIGQARQHANRPDSQKDEFRVNLPHPNDVRALQNYRQHYSYDAVGNMLQVRHIAGVGEFTHRWTKTMSYNNNDVHRQALKVDAKLIKNNQILQYEVGTDQQRYAFDEHGNMKSIQPNATSKDFNLSWNCFDQLKHIVLPSGSAHYYYDASGQRSRKIITDGARVIKERIYIGSLEVNREFNGDSTTKLERESLHIQDDTQRIALVDTKTIDHPDDDTQEQLLRFQYSNHLGSVSLELDESGVLISYEEYYPYGTTSYQAVNGAIRSAAKRYRYTGMERDEESGLNYHSARYYLPWLGRWLSADPIGIGGGINTYGYTNSNPINLIDKMGKQSEPLPGLIGNNPAVGQAWEEAVVKKLSHKFQTKDYSSIVQAFQDEISTKIANNNGSLGSNKKKGTAINYARGTYSKVRTEFGKILRQKGISLDGIQVHHMFSELAKIPQDAISTTNLMFVRGNAATKGTGHNFAHQLSEAFEAGIKDPAQHVISKLHMEGVTPDVPELASTLTQSPVSQTENPQAIKNNKVVGKGRKLTTSAKRLAKTGRHLAKAGKHFVKAIPILGVVLGHASAAQAASQGDYTTAALDEFGNVPVAGDLVDAARGGVEIGRAIDEGFGLSNDPANFEAGQTVENTLRDLGASEDIARVAGGITAAGSALRKLSPAYWAYRGAKALFD